MPIESSVTLGGSLIHCTHTKIRGGRGNFSWLKNPERAVEFLPELESFW